MCNNASVICETQRENLLAEGRDNVFCDHKGIIYCYLSKDLKKREMVSGGFEKDRQALENFCTAEYYSAKCQGEDSCPIRSGIRMPLEEDMRMPAPVTRSSLT